MEKDIIYNKDERLSKNFQLGEFIESDTAKRKGIDNTPNEEIIENIRLLVTSLLQPIRDRISYPFHINSGYRCKELNKAVGGSETSAHLQGLAADITLGSKQLNRILWEEIERGNFDFDQVIDENNLTWVHIGIKKDRKKNRHSMFKLYKKRK